MYSLTIYEPDSRHGDGEEGVLLHWNLHQDGCEEEEDEDEDQAACYPHPLRDPDRKRFIGVNDDAVKMSSSQKPSGILGLFHEKKKKRSVRLNQKFLTQ